jgi:hypothetical protein
MSLSHENYKVADLLADDNLTAAFGGVIPLLGFSLSVTVTDFTASFVAATKATVTS